MFLESRKTLTQEVSLEEIEIDCSTEELEDFLGDA